jgi:hypothetical protein
MKVIFIEVLFASYPQHGEDSALCDGQAMAYHGEFYPVVGV